MSKEKLQLILSVIFGCLFVLLLMVTLVMLFRIYLKRKNKLLLEKQLMAVAFEQTLLQSKLEIQEETFTNISNELHDNVGQVLSLVNLNLNTLNAPGEEQKLKSMDEMLEKAMLDLRNLSRSLDAEHLRNKGWEEPVKKLLRQIEQTGKHSIEIDIEEGLPSIGKDKPIILYRMIQEVLNNIIKHAEAEHISFDAKNIDSMIQISIRDNGRGFDSNKLSEGAGLRNLENRAKMINANISFESEPGKGTAITIAVKYL